ncbi:MAG: hypothetical protein WKF77_31185 [Planctomycetaceae bacterium]
MIVRSMTHPINRPTLDELAVFERQFQYPLGPGNHFSISHGSEYLPFFAAMGAATLLVAVHLGSIVGSSVLVRRQLVVRDSGSGESHNRCLDAHYICDLKVRSDARSGSALARLTAAAADIIRPCQSHACYSVVMAGTSAEPAAYTGRLNIPHFAAVGEVAILRFLTAPSSEPSKVVDSPPEQFAGLHDRLGASGVWPAAGDPFLRSLIAFQRFCHVNETACGLLEDTRRGKRLIQASGEEIVSAHLSRFRWSVLAAAEDLLKHALNRSFELGFPAMFCSMPSAAWTQLKPLLHRFEYQQTSATVYGYHVPDSLDWWIDTSEI